MAFRRWKPKLIAVTGSVGKTSTKDAIHSIFSKLSTAEASEKSFNSEIGVPLAVLGLANPWNHLGKWLIALVSGMVTALFQRKPADWFVLEIGADRPGDIERITHWIRPDIAVINKIGNLPVHVEFFASPEEVAKEKSFLAKALKTNGTLVVYADDEHALKIRDSVKRRSYSFGFDDKADIVASNYQIQYGSKRPVGISFKVGFDGKILPVMLKGVLGRQHVYPALAAIGTAVAAGLNIVSAIEALRDHKSPNGRMRLIQGVKDSILIDDTYNSSPAALNEALNALHDIAAASRKIAVLGDMRELGTYSRAAHLAAGKEAARVCDLLLTVGEGGMIIAEGALDAGMKDDHVRQYSDAVEAGKELQNLIQPNDTILIKGSQGVRMEKIVEEIMAEPETAGVVLVRQEAEWKKR